MNDSEKMILKSSLTEEEKILKLLQREYTRARTDCKNKIAELDSRTDLENIQSIVYQKKYQEAILSQIEGTLAQLQSNQYKDIVDYMNKCYENGYLGAMYSINAQGLPIITPIDNRQVIDALYNDTKLSQGLYNRLGEDINDLKVSIKANLSRGIVEGKSWQEVAEGIANEMNTPFKRAMNNAMRIARTEGGRVQQQASFNMAQKAQSRGADIVKQWDSTLDGRTRESHREIDGEVRELDEKFSNGLLFPKHPDGAAGEVINCRCVMLQRARWALNNGFTKMDNFGGVLESFDTPKDYETFKKAYFSKENVAYMNFVNKMELKYDKALSDPEKYLDESDLMFLDLQRIKKNPKDFRNLLDIMSEEDYAKYKELLDANPIFKANPTIEPLELEEKKEYKFKPANDIIEVKQRIADTLGISESVIELGRMKIDLANQYLEGIERFAEEFPEIKGLYTYFDTKCGSKYVMGVNKIEGRAINYNTSKIKYGLALKNPKSLQELMDLYEFSSKSGHSYINACPLSTAVHELAHGIDHVIRLKENGFFDNGNLTTEIYRWDWNKYISRISTEVIKEARDECFPGMSAREIYNQISYLGSYAMTNYSEQVAEAVSYDYVNETTPYTSAIRRILREKINEVFYGNNV